MNIYLVARHYIFNLSSAQFLERVNERFQSVHELSKSNIHLLILVSANFKNLSEEVAKKTLESIKKVEDAGIPIVFVDRGLTAGQKLVRALFENIKIIGKEDVLGLFDIDQ